MPHDESGPSNVNKENTADNNLLSLSKPEHANKPVAKDRQLLQTNDNKPLEGGNAPPDSKCTIENQFTDQYVSLVAPPQQMGYQELVNQPPFIEKSQLSTN